MLKEIKWEDEFLIGNKEIDHLHKELLERINLCIRGANGHLGDIKIDQLMLGLFRYTKWHFKIEESLMEIHEYPEKKSHLEEHTDLLNMLEEEIKKFQTTKTHFQEITSFFSGWFGAHTLDSDKKMADYLNDMSQNEFAIN